MRWLALAENHIGPNAVKCNDVITALNGTTIELINTDAEGRMVLADTLQCRTQGAGDHLYAARFLGRFVGEGIDWVHVDMASSGTHKGGLAQIPTDV